MILGNLDSRKKWPIWKVVLQERESGVGVAVYSWSIVGVSCRSDWLTGGQKLHIVFRNAVYKINTKKIKQFCIVSRFRNLIFLKTGDRDLFFLHSSQIPSHSPIHHSFFSLKPCVRQYKWAMRHFTGIRVGGGGGLVLLGCSTTLRLPHVDNNIPSKVLSTFWTVRSVLWVII